MNIPIVAIVGRPNVGKSTLFNRIAGERLAVVSEIPGTTRDRLVVESEWRGRRFNLVDTGGIDPTDLSRAEPLSLDSADYIEPIRAQAQAAAHDADVVLLVVDVEAGPTPADDEVAQILRRRPAGAARRSAPVLLVVNKCDNAARKSEAVSFFELGMGDPHPISAMHGRGIGDLLDDIVERLPPQPTAAVDDETSIRIAIVGKPNAGKSSLLNRLLGQERVLVSPIPGTTRDAVDTQLTYHGQTITLIDTAGIRRRGKVEPGVEKYSVLRALRAIERADVVLVMIDALTGVTAQDTHIAGLVLDKYRSVVVLVNKWDLVEKDSHTMHEYAARVQERLRFLPHVPVLFISALTGQRVSEVLPLAVKVQEERLRRIPTSAVNRMLREALAHHPPPTRSGKQLRLYYGSQVRTDPPTFVFHANDPKLVHFSYARYLENQIRQRYSFLGTPLRLSFRRRKQA